MLIFLLGSLDKVLFGLIIKENIKYLLTKLFKNYQSIINYQLACAFLNWLGHFWRLTQPLFWHLFLHYYERKCLPQTKIWAIQACPSSIIFRFVDGLCIANNNELENNFENISPDELELKKENYHTCKRSFFEYLIEVHDRNF